MEEIITIKKNIYCFFIKKQYQIIISLIYECITGYFGYLYILHNKDLAMSNLYASSRCLSQFSQNCTLIISLFFAFIIIFLLVDFFFITIKDRNEDNYLVLFFSVVEFIFLINFFFYGYFIDQTWSYVGDELNIHSCAILKNPFMFVYTSGIHLVSLFIFPFMFGPILLKLIFVSFICGYISEKLWKKYKSKFQLLLLLLLFSTPAFLTFGIEIHRMQYYGPLYVFIMLKIYMDRNDSSKSNVLNLIFVCFVLGLLTVLRREGFYLSIIGLILVLNVYSKKIIIKKIILTFYSILLIVALPTIMHELKSPLQEKGHTYFSYLVWMMREKQFNFEKNENEIKKIEKVIDLDKVKDSFVLGNRLYNEAYWEYGRYASFRNDFTNNDMKEAEQSILKIVISQFPVFLKSRIRAFLVKGLVKDSYNYFVPFCLTILIFIYSIIKKEVLLCIMTFSVLLHTLITIITMPVNYCKYFFELYLFGYVFFIMIINDFLKMIIIENNP